MNLARTLFIAAIVAFLWHHKAENSEPSKLSGYYEMDGPSPKFSMKFIDDHQVQVYHGGNLAGSCTYKIKGNNVEVEHKCGPWIMEIQGDILYKKDHGWRFRLQR